MKWVKLVRYDLQYGLLRFRYFLVPLITLIPCFRMFRILQSGDLIASCVDYLVYIFEGIEPIQSKDPTDHILLPIMWIAMIGSSLLLNFDYMLKDLTNAGQQVIIRCDARKEWFLSKIVWNLASTALYFVLLLLTVIFFVLFTDGKLTLINTPAVVLRIFSKVTPKNTTLSVFEGVAVTLFVPFISVAAMNILNMTLCLIVKPITGLLISMALMILAVYVNSPLALGNGAMTIRSVAFVTGGHDPMSSVYTAVAVILICSIVGAMHFKNIDILSAEN